MAELNFSTLAALSRFSVPPEPVLGPLEWRFGAQGRFVEGALIAIGC